MFLTLVAKGLEEDGKVFEIPYNHIDFYGIEDRVEYRIVPTAGGITLPVMESVNEIRRRIEECIKENV